MPGKAESVLTRQLLMVCHQIIDGNKVHYVGNNLLIMITLVNFSQVPVIKLTATRAIALVHRVVCS